MKNQEKQSKESKDCCGNIICENNKDKGILKGIAFGIIPHTGCILFIIAAIFGATLATTFFKPFLMNKYFFFGLIALSLLFATLSAGFYLKKQSLLNFEGIKKKKGYLTIMYGLTIAINLLLFLFIFPLLANVGASSGDFNSDDLNSFKIKVAIPCSGHALLITDELKIAGAENVLYEFPNYFIVSYNSSKISKEGLLSLDVFKEYKATIV